MSEFKRFFRISALGVWIFTTIPLVALCGLATRSIERVDKWLGIDDPDLLGEPVEPPISKYR